MARVAALTSSNYKNKRLGKSQNTRLTHLDKAHWTVVFLTETQTAITGLISEKFPKGVLQIILRHANGRW